MDEFPKFDDVGSFPLPEYVDKASFNKFYWIAYQALLNKSDLDGHRGIYNYVIHPILQSFQLKLNAGVEVINFPQHMDIYAQFMKPLQEHEIEPDLIDNKKAIVLEIKILEEFAKEYFERTGKPLNVKSCVTGPIELYLKKHDFTIYPDMALNLSKTVNSFLKSSIINKKQMKTSVISIDEPSFGYVELANVGDDELIKIFDKSLEGVNADRQIHLHTLNQASIPLKTKNVDILTCEYASDNKNVIPKRELDAHDKFIRVGITRTNINSIMAEALDSGKNFDQIKTFEGTMSLIDSKERIEKNLNDAIKHYDDRLKYIGPDCGLSGWSPPQIAYELLHRTYEVIRKNREEMRTIL